MRAIIQAIRNYIGRIQGTARYRRLVARQRDRWLAGQTKRAAVRAAFLVGHPNWERRCQQIELDNALHCWRQATPGAERDALMRELGPLLRPYWEAKRQATQEAWAKHHVWQQERK